MNQFKQFHTNLSRIEPKKWYVRSKMVCKGNLQIQSRTTLGKCRKRPSHFTSEKKLKRFQINKLSVQRKKQARIKLC